MRNRAKLIAGACDAFTVGEGGVARGTAARFLEAVAAPVGAFLATAGAPDAAQRDPVPDPVLDSLQRRGGTNQIEPPPAARRRP